MRAGAWTATSTVRPQYVTDWVADKTRYQLSVDPSEEAALSETLSRCPNKPITVTLARKPGFRMRLLRPLGLVSSHIEGVYSVCGFGG
ncbi:hypothetical protein [Streptomyces sp. NPDC001530]|uniref:hypothetical protein n=1 Tax=Streptomyces sp. NPDC001530 TaxID=3364582 RepID=UPI0036BC05FD